MQAKHCAHLFGAAQFELAQTAPLFDPGKNLLDAPVGIDRLGLALVPGGSAINGGAIGASGVLGHMRRDADATHLACVIVQLTVRAWRLSISTWPR